MPTVLHTTSIWLTVVLAVQRYVYICHPVTARRYCSIRNVVRGRKCFVCVCDCVFLMSALEEDGCVHRSLARGSIYPSNDCLQFQLVEIIEIDKMKQNAIWWKYNQMIWNCFKKLRSAFVTFHGPFSFSQFWIVQSVVRKDTLEWKKYQRLIFLNHFRCTSDTFHLCHFTNSALFRNWVLLPGLSFKNQQHGNSFDMRGIKFEVDQIVGIGLLYFILFRLWSFWEASNRQHHEDPQV